MGTNKNINKILVCLINPWSMGEKKPIWLESKLVWSIDFCLFLDKIDGSIYR
jgi:hypothetical protein